MSCATTLYLASQQLICTIDQKAQNKQNDQKAQIDQNAQKEQICTIDQKAQIDQNAQNEQICTIDQNDQKAQKQRPPASAVALPREPQRRAVV